MPLLDIRNCELVARVPLWRIRDAVVKFLKCDIYNFFFSRF